MSNCKQFVVCQHNGDSKKYLFYAPAFSDIKICDEVVVETKFGPKTATVCAVCTVYNEDTEFALRVLAGAEDKPVKRVIGKYQLIKLDNWEDENNG